MSELFPLDEVERAMLGLGEEVRGAGGVEGWDGRVGLANVDWGELGVDRWLRPRANACSLVGCSLGGKDSWRAACQCSWATGR